MQLLGGPRTALLILTAAALILLLSGRLISARAGAAWRCQPPEG